MQTAEKSDSVSDTTIGLQALVPPKDFIDMTLPEYTDNDKVMCAETMRHILTLRTILSQFCAEFINRGNKHDLSKLQPPEMQFFTINTPKLKNIKYGSPEYAQSMDEMRPGITNHYLYNTHHPEHFAAGIRGMDLFDILEMLADWKASTLRSPSGNIFNSLKHNQERFNISEDLYLILFNTLSRIEEMGNVANIHVSYPHITKEEA